MAERSFVPTGPTVFSHVLQAVNCLPVFGRPDGTSRRRAACTGSRRRYAAHVFACEMMGKHVWRKFLKKDVAWFGVFVNFHAPASEKARDLAWQKDAKTSGEKFLNIFC
jgi:hypothetical protein